MRNKILNNKIAKYCGWKFNTITQRWSHPKKSGIPPMYTRNIKAMYKLESRLNWFERNQYNEFLYFNLKPDQHIYHASPLMRAKAFVHVKEL